MQVTNMVLKNVQQLNYSTDHIVTNATLTTRTRRPGVDPGRLIQNHVSWDLLFWWDLQVVLAFNVVQATRNCIIFLFLGVPTRASVTHTECKQGCPRTSSLQSV